MRSLMKGAADAQWDFGNGYKAAVGSQTGQTLSGGISDYTWCLNTNPHLLYLHPSKYTLLHTQQRASTFNVEEKIKDHIPGKS